VFTAFSGSHQDAIKKSWPHQKPGHPWDVIYIPIDPADIGRTYKAIIRINSQSGKGGVAYILETEFGYQLPKLMHKEIGKVINDLADRSGTELSPAEIHTAFQQEYIERAAPALVLREFRTTERGTQVTCEAEIKLRDAPLPLRFTGTGNGPIDAFVRGLASTGRVPAFDVQSYNEHSLGSGAEARAVSYIQIKLADGRTLFGAGVDTNIEVASIRAIVSALNRALA
jgi:2-isopropylmalate synthase